MVHPTITFSGRTTKRVDVPETVADALMVHEDELTGLSTVVLTGSPTPEIASPEVKARAMAGVMPVSVRPATGVPTGGPTVIVSAVTEEVAARLMVRAAPPVKD